MLFLSAKGLFVKAMLEAEQERRQNNWYELQLKLPGFDEAVWIKQVSAGAGYTFPAPPPRIPIIWMSIWMSSIWMSHQLHGFCFTWLCNTPASAVLSGEEHTCFDMIVPTTNILLNYSTVSAIVWLCVLCTSTIITYATLLLLVLLSSWKKILQTSLVTSNWKCLIRLHHKPLKILSGR